MTRRSRARKDTCVVPKLNRQIHSHCYKVQSGAWHEKQTQTQCCFWISQRMQTHFPCVHCPDLKHSRIVESYWMHHPITLQMCRSPLKFWIWVLSHISKPCGFVSSINHIFPSRWSFISLDFRWFAKENLPFATQTLNLSARSHLKTICLKENEVFRFSWSLITLICIGFLVMHYAMPRSHFEA